MADSPHLSICSQAEYLSRALQVKKAPAAPAPAQPFDRCDDCTFRLGLVYKRMRQYRLRATMVTIGTPGLTEISLRSARPILILMTRSRYTKAMKCFSQLHADQLKLHQSKQRPSHDTMPQLVQHLSTQYTTLGRLRQGGYTTEQASAVTAIGAIHARIAAVRSLSELWYAPRHIIILTRTLD